MQNTECRIAQNMQVEIVHGTKVTGCYSIFAKSYVIISVYREIQLYVQEVQINPSSERSVRRLRTPYNKAYG